MDYRAEVFDQMQLLYDLTGFNDHQLHCVLRFESRPDGETLRKAVIASIKAIPILGTRYVSQGGRPRWESIDETRFGDAYIAVRRSAEFDGFVTHRIDETAGPQVKVCLLDSDNPAIALTMNHMVCDAAGFKEYLYFLCRVYSETMADPGYEPVPITGDRSMRGVMGKFGPIKRLRSLLRQGKDNNRSGVFRFPLSEGGDERPFILTRKLGRERMEAIKEYCRTHGATVNDVALAAFYRCLFRRLALASGIELCIPVMIDMRRYLDEEVGFEALTNLSSTATTCLTHASHEAFTETLRRVKEVMDEKKGSEMGLNAFIKLNMVYALLPNKLANLRVQRGLKNPLICMTNIGILESERMSFGDLRPHDAFMCGSVKYKPHFQLAMSSYDGELTLSSNLYGTALDREHILSFLGEVEKEIP